MQKATELANTNVTFGIYRTPKGDLVTVTRDDNDQYVLFVDGEAIAVSEVTFNLLLNSTSFEDWRVFSPESAQS
jgi:predicted MarR family transcription regulator